MSDWWPTFDGYPIVLTNEGPDQLEALKMTPADLADALAAASPCPGDPGGHRRFQRRHGKFAVCIAWKGREIKVAGLFTDHAVVVGGGPGCLVWHAKPSGR